MASRSRHLGIDIGSVSVKAVVMSASAEILDCRYQRHLGHPLSALHTVLSELGSADTVSVTGSAGGLIGKLFGTQPINEVVAQAAATVHLLPDCRTVIEMGGEDSKLILLEEGRIHDFSMNALCAAGTGSFLDQQAERLRLSIEGFSRLALQCPSPPRIAGRCSVFAKSDMIHLQQIATPVEDIASGLCFAVARNFRSAICRNRHLCGPISFHGGVAANEGVLRAFREIFGRQDITRPTHYAFMGAIGAVLADLERVRRGQLKEMAPFRPFCTEALHLDQQKDALDPLVPDPEAFWSRHRVEHPIHREKHQQRIRIWLGIDIGSISTNLVLVDAEGRLLAKRYLRTAGRPIEAVMNGLREIQEEIGERAEVVGVGTTGSGRYMIADVVGADIVRNEITAQATAAAFIDSEVDTIFEIGGQDSKYIGLRNGVVVDFEMNKACAAGTGSFLEEQAERLSIPIRDEFAAEAISSDAPCSLGERCTVFMENSLMSRLQKGAEKRDLLAGLAYSIVRNYLNRVVGDRPIGKRIFFQGGTAFNKAVVAAFEQVLGRPVIVPPHHDVTGAIGMALLARRQTEATGSLSSRFKGFDIWKRPYSVRSQGCTGCDNVCEINTVRFEGLNETLVYGGRCEKYDVRRKPAVADLPRLFDDRNRWLSDAHEARRAAGTGPYRGRIGLPRLFNFQDTLPFWSTLLWELGFDVVVSPDTNGRIIRSGLEAVSGETCYPVKVAHGHISHLVAAGVDAIFLPSMVGLNTEEDAYRRGVSCPYSQSLPYLSTVSLGRYSVVTPVVDYESGRDTVIREILRGLRKYGVTLRLLREAYEGAERAQADFRRKISRRGREVIAGLTGRAIVIVGRAYNAFDPALNLNIPKKLLELGVLPIPMDFLPLDEAEIGGLWPGMYWRSGQRILQAARIVRDHPFLYPVFVTNFSCGPDSFLLRFFKETLAGKPFLQIEIDEHSADAGAVTRLEAFLDSLDHAVPVGAPAVKRTRAFQGADLKNRTVFVPRMSDHSRALAAAFRAQGVRAEVLPPPDSLTPQIGRRYVSGKECYPCCVTTGDMVRKATAPDFDPERSVFLMPSGIGPCRFGQYQAYHRLVLDELGLDQVPIFTPVQQAGFYRELGMVGREFVKLTLAGVWATDLLLKRLHATRPYEKRPGEADAVYRAFLNRLEASIETGGMGIENILNEAGDAFSGIPRHGFPKPLVGVVGEIFVRSNSFSNEDLVRKIEDLGGEVWLSPVFEWFLYINFTGRRRALRLKNWRALTTELYSQHFLHRLERRLAKAGRSTIRTLPEPSVERIVRHASPWLHPSFEGEAILSVGKAVDLAVRGASGVINAMPFGCMPGTIAGAMLKAVRETHGIPYMNAAYDGTESSTFPIHLEAFMHQVKERASV